MKKCPPAFLRAFNRQGYCVAALSERPRDATGIGNIALKMEEPPYQQSQGEPLLKRCLFQRQNVLFRFVPRVLRQVVAGGLAAGKLIAAFVLGMAVVPAHPFQRDAVVVELDLQALPEIAVLDRFLGGGLPAVFPPQTPPVNCPVRFPLCPASPADGC